MDAVKYLKLKKKLEQWQRDKDRAEGAKAQLMKKLKQDFGCRTLKQAKKQLRKLEREEREAETEFVRAIRAFERKWKHKL